MTQHHLHQLYAAWSHTHGLTGDDLTRMLTVAVDHNDPKMLKELLGNRQCTQRHRDQVRTRGDAICLSTLLAHPDRNDETGALVEWQYVLDDIDDETTLHIIVSEAANMMPDPVAEQLWDRNDRNLRIALLNHLSSSRIRRAWHRWLLQDTFDGHVQVRRSTFEQLARRDSHWLWSIVRGDLELMIWVYQAAEKSKRGSDWDERMLQQIEAFLAQPEPAADLLPELVTVIVAMGSAVDGFRKRLPISARLRGGAELLAALVDEPLRTTLLEPFRINTTTEDGDGTRETITTTEILDALRDDQPIPAATLRLALDGPHVLGEPLWAVLSRHPRLTCEQAASMISALGEWSHLQEILAVLAGRDDSWLTVLLQKLWNGRPAEGGNRTVLRSIAERMSDDARAAVLHILAAGNIDAVARIVQLDLHTDEVLRAVVVSDIGAGETRVQDLLLDLTRRVLAPIPDGWAMFDGIVETLDETTTFGELFDTVVCLAAPASR